MKSNGMMEQLDVIEHVQHGLELMGVSVPDQKEVPRRLLNRPVLFGGIYPD